MARRLKNKGFLMIAAVTLIVVFALLGTALSLMFISSSNSPERFNAANKASGLAESGLGLGASSLTIPDLSSRLTCATLAGTVTLSTGTGTVSRASDSANSVNPRLTATTLGAAIASNTSPTTITVASTAALAPSGSVMIGREVFKYKRLANSTTLAGVTRAQSGTLTAAHPLGTYVSQYECMMSSTGNSPASNPKGVRQYQQGIQQPLIFAGGANGSILLYNDLTSELLWLLQLTGITVMVNGIDMVNYHLGWAVAQKSGLSTYTILKNENGTWNLGLVTLSSAQDLNAVSAPSETEAWAVGIGTSTVYSLLHWTGGAINAWCRLTTSAGACGQTLDSSAFSYSGSLDLFGVDTVDVNGDGISDFGFAVGGINSLLIPVSGRPRLLRYNGTTWTKDTLNSAFNVQRLYGVKIIRNGSNTPVEAWAAGEQPDLLGLGGQGVILKWTGGAWTLATNTTTDMRAIDMIDTNDDGIADYGVAVGNGGKGYIYSGGSWTGPYSWASSKLNAVVVISPSEFYAVGDGGLRLQFNGLSLNSLLNLISFDQYNAISAVFPKKQPLGPWYDVIN